MNEAKEVAKAKPKAVPRLHSSTGLPQGILRVVYSSWQEHILSISYGDCTTMYCAEVLYKGNRSPSEKWRRFENILPSHAERFVCCALTIRYITYSTVGWSIASISDLGSTVTLALCASVNMVPRSDKSAIDLPTVLYVLHTF